MNTEASLLHSYYLDVFDEHVKAPSVQQCNNQSLIMPGLLTAQRQSIVTINHNCILRDGNAARVKIVLSRLTIIKLKSSCMSIEKK